MKVQAVSPKAQNFSGLYFTKCRIVLFSNQAEYVTNEPVKIATKGAQYIEDSNVSSSVKRRYSKIKFIKDLAKNNDVFIWHREIPPSEVNNNYLSVAKVSWLNERTGYSESRLAKAQSKTSQKEANRKMFGNLVRSKFSDVY